MPVRIWKPIRPFMQNKAGSSLAFRRRRPGFLVGWAICISSTSHLHLIYIQSTSNLHCCQRARSQWVTWIFNLKNVEWRFFSKKNKFSRYRVVIKQILLLPPPQFLKSVKPKSVIRFLLCFVFVSNSLQRSCWRHSGLWRNADGGKMAKQRRRRVEKKDKFFYNTLVSV